MWSVHGAGRWRGIDLGGLVAACRQRRHVLVGGRRPPALTSKPFVLDHTPTLTAPDDSTGR